MSRIVPFCALALALAAPFVFHDAVCASAAESSSEEISIIDISLIPMPPAMDSVQFMLDQARYAEGLVERRGPKGDEAAADADTDKLPTRFSEAIGLDISKEKTPALYALAAYVSKMAKAKGAGPAQERAMRIRPYVLHNAGTCFPADEARLKNVSSYPSGHTARGWAVAQALCEVAPARTDQLMRRGYEYGQSRVVCGYHWQSDVDAARLIADAVMAKLRNSPKYQRLVREGREEYEHLTAKAGK